MSEAEEEPAGEGEAEEFPDGASAVGTESDGDGEPPLTVPMQPWECAAETGSGPTVASISCIGPAGRDTCDAEQPFCCANGNYELSVCMDGPTPRRPGCDISGSADCCRLLQGCVAGGCGTGEGGRPYYCASDPDLPADDLHVMMCRCDPKPGAYIVCGEDSHCPPDRPRCGGFCDAGPCSCEAEK